MHAIVQKRMCRILALIYYPNSWVPLLGNTFYSIAPVVYVIKQFLEEIS